MNNTERKFLFIDETGDPGHPDQRNASRYYQLNILATERTQLGKILREFSRFRYFIQADKELERYTRWQKKILLDLCTNLFEEGVVFYSFCLRKENYLGPYLQSIGHSKRDYNPRKFRNFVIRKSLETFFQNETIQTGQEIELIIDRFLDNENDEQNLKDYLRGNYALPPFLHIVQIDSMYSDATQIADVFGSLVKFSLFDGKVQEKELYFAKLYELENPNKIRKRESPDTL